MWFARRNEPLPTDCVWSVTLVLLLYHQDLLNNDTQLSLKSTISLKRGGGAVIAYPLSTTFDRALTNSSSVISFDKDSNPQTQR